MHSTQKKKQTDTSAPFTKKFEDATQYCIVPKTIAEMVGREHEFYQYQEAMADSDEEAVEYRQKQQEIIDFIFSKL